MRLTASLREIAAERAREYLRLEEESRKAHDVVADAIRVKLAGGEDYPTTLLTAAMAADDDVNSAARLLAMTVAKDLVEATTS